MRRHGANRRPGPAERKKRRPAEAGRARVGRGVIRDVRSTVPASAAVRWGHVSRRPISRNNRFKTIGSRYNPRSELKSPKRETRREQTPDRRSEFGLSWPAALNFLSRPSYPRSCSKLKLENALLPLPFLRAAFGHLDPPLAPLEQSLPQGNSARVGDQDDHGHDDGDLQCLSDHAG